MKSAGLLVCLFVVACSHETAPEAKIVQNTSKAPVIFSLQTHDAKVSVLSGADMRVAVTRNDATTIATLDELRVKEPELFEIVTSAVAHNGAYLDATFHETPAHELR